MSNTRKPTGRAVADEKGNLTWTWTGETNMDTARVRALGEDLSLETPAPADAQPALDPYNRSGAPADSAAKSAKRRTLDDMRRLSEQIKNTRIWKRGD